MTILRNLLGGESRSVENPLRPLTSASLISVLGGSTTHSGIAVSETTAAGKYIALYRSITLIAGAIAGLPFEAHRIGLKREPFRSLLLEKPHPDMTRMELWEWLLCSLLSAGHAFALKTRDANYRVSMLDPVAPDRVKMRKTSRSDLNPRGMEYDVRDEKGQTKTFTSDQMLHIPGPMGLSPIGVARQSIGGALAAEEYSGRLWASGSLMAGVLQTEQRLDEQHATALKQRWQEKVAGLAHAHEVAILDSGAKFQPISITPADAQLLEARKFHVTDIARLYGIPLHLLADMEKSSSWGCLPGDSMVFTKQGPQPINEVTVGTKVWSLDEGKGLVEGEVTAWQMTGVKPLLTIETTARTLRATENHRVPIRRYVGRSASKRGEAGWSDMWVRADQIALGDHLMIPHGLASSTGTVAPNGRQLTPDAMAFCGLFLGDGSLDGNRVEIAHESEPDHMNHYRAVIASEFGVKPYVTKRLTCTRFSSKPAVELLSSGFTGTALTKRVPGWVFGLTSELQLALLRGYLDADGSVQRGRIVYSSAHKALLEDVRHLCIGLGIPVGRVCLGRPAGRGTIRGRSFQAQAKYQLSLSSVPFNSRIGSASPRKAARFVDTATKRRLRYDESWTGAGTTGHPVGVGWSYPDMALQRVTKLSRSPIAVPVYDITVTGTASFVSDGVLVHNTGIEQMAIGFVVFTLRPWLIRLEQRISDECLPRGIEAHFHTDELTLGDAKTRSEADAIDIQNGVRSFDEVRIKRGIAPRPGGDRFMVPLNMTILDSEGLPLPAEESGEEPAQLLEEIPNAFEE